MNIYLDIDGVILANELQPAKYAKEFLKFITDNYEVYWLTTHCKGDAEYTVNFLHRFFDLETIGYLKKIRPTNWKTNKTEAVDFSCPFLWLDDFILKDEEKILVKNNALHNWVEVDLEKNIEQLKDIVSYLQ